ncbi:tRNA (N6-threonylcarbamoyladenosine(37)-N6)-methyltransferase TrmO [candidate division WOR-3 bacterium]|nr:tRNA (N6-threonylcarbamoyladenosine(37)-N6)-methyltransferase TrmO [candidate division WOR-3 bacterium]
MDTMHVELNFIGTIHSPFTTKEQAPPQGKDTIGTIELFKKFQDGLKDIEGFSHLHLFYWLHQTHEPAMIVQTPWDDTPHGLFAVRSPHRVNPIGYAVVELLKIEQNILTVKGIDALDGTPVTDIKPYISDIDARRGTRSGWLGSARRLEPKAYSFSVTSQWHLTQPSLLKGENKEPIIVGCPIEFGGTTSNWSPEHLFVGSINVCIMTTFFWLLSRTDVQIEAYESTSVGRASLTRTGFRFTHVTVEPRIQINDETQRASVLTLLHDAAKQCMVTNSLICQVSVHPVIVLPASGT